MVRKHVPLVIIMPTYEDRPSATELLRELAASCPIEPYIIVVEDGSLRGPLVGSCIAQAGLSGEILYLARNMGHQRAIAAGLCYVASNFETGAVVVMDSDGEDTPAAISALLLELEQPDVDAVVALRRKRSEKISFRAFYVIYRSIFHILTGRTIGFGNFTALSDRAVRRIAAMQELWVHFPGSLMISRLRISEVPTDRGVRYAGKSQMNFVSLSLHGLRSIMVFAEDVLVRVGMFCAALAAITVALLVLTAGLKLVGFATPGWFSQASGILIIILLQSGILMFTTLMVSGIVRSAPPFTNAQIELLVERIVKVHPSEKRPRAGVGPTLGE